MLSIESLNAPEHEEFPLLLSISNFVARAVSVPNGGLPVFFGGKKYHAAPMRRSARTIEICMVLFMVVKN